jgi:hypothetical protein
VVRAAYSKRRREDAQPIPRWLVDALRPWLSTKGSGVPVFKVPGKKTAALVRVDLAVAKDRWVAEATDPSERRRRAESDYLAVQDRAGSVLDLDGLRHTFISSIVRGGASVKVAQELARHSTPTLTFCRVRARKASRPRGGARRAAGPRAQGRSRRDGRENGRGRVSRRFGLAQRTALLVGTERVIPAAVHLVCTGASHRVASRRARSA